MKNPFFVLGTGESISQYVPIKDIPSIGVNDTPRYAHCDYLLCLDPIRLFGPDRLVHMKSATCRNFFSQLPEWNGEVKNFQLITLQKPRGDLSQLDGPNVCYSMNSPFAACVLAYRMGANEIIMYGVDFNTHKTFSNVEKKLKVKVDFVNLHGQLKKRNVKLFVGSESSYLAEFLPVAKKY